MIMEVLYKVIEMIISGEELSTHIWTADVMLTQEILLFAGLKKYGIQN